MNISHPILPLLSQERVAHYERERGQALYQQSLEMGAGSMMMRPDVGFRGAAGPSGYRGMAGPSCIDGEAGPSSSYMSSNPHGDGIAFAMGGSGAMQQPLEPYAHRPPSGEKKSQI